MAIRLKRLGRAAIHLLLLAIILGLLLFLRGCVARPSTSYSGGHFNQGKNAAWLGVEWTNEAHSDREITQLADDLTHRQIRYVFAYTTYWRNNGQFNPTFDHAADFVRVLKAAQPDLIVLAWIGLPLKPNFGTVDLSDPAMRQQITDMSVRFVMQLGFDGIHLDPESVRDGDNNVLILLDETRQAIRPAKLSIAMRAIQALFPGSVTIFSDLLGLHSAYYRQFASYIDQIAVMSYDSTLESAWLYRQWMRFQVIEITQAMQGADVELLFGIPTSEEVTDTHKPEAENLVNGLQGVLDGLNDLEAVPSAVTGIAIYPYWETDASEWATYESMWLK